MQIATKLCHNITCNSSRCFSLAFRYATLPLQNRSLQNFAVTRKCDSPHYFSLAFRDFAAQFRSNTIYGFTFHNLTLPLLLSTQLLATLPWRHTSLHRYSIALLRISKQFHCKTIHFLAVRSLSVTSQHISIPLLGFTILF